MRVRAAWRWLSEGPSVDEATRRDFLRWTADLMGRASPWLILFFLVVAVAWWPTDAIVYDGLPEAQRAYGWLRGTIAVVHVICLTLARGLFRRFPVACGTALAAGEIIVCGALLGTIGGLDGPWVHYLYTAPWISVALVRPLGRRLLGSAALGFGGLLGYLVSAGDQWSHPLLPSTASAMLFSVFFAALVGHGTWLLLRENFVQQRLITDQRARLDAFSQQLEARVAEQTRDLQVLSRRLDGLREEERRWMARELHDALGQELTAVRYGLDLARARLPAEQRGVAVTLRDVDQRIGLAHGSIRRILQRLRPQMIDELGLGPALENLRRQLDDAGLAATLSLTGLDAHPLSPEREAALYRVAQEAVTNVLRHARAGAVEIGLHVTAGRATLWVADDGVGLAGAEPSPDGAGCIGIRERIGALGGVARWIARPGGGTRVDIELPTTPSTAPSAVPSSVPPSVASSVPSSVPPSVPSDMPPEP